MSSIINNFLFRISRIFSRNPTTLNLTFKLRPDHEITIALVGVSSCSNLGDILRLCKK